MKQLMKSRDVLLKNVPGVGWGGVHYEGVGGVGCIMKGWGRVGCIMKGWVG